MELSTVSSAEHFGDLTKGAADDGDADRGTLLEEFQDGSDPTDSNTDNDGTRNRSDASPQNRLGSPSGAFPNAEGAILD